jgi:hypothetical protein
MWARFTTYYQLEKAPDLSGAFFFVKRVRMMQEGFVTVHIENEGFI